MPLVDLDDPEELRARWSALAAVAHATGFDRRWYADENGWYHQDETGSDLRMVRLEGGRAVLFGFHTEHSRTAGADLLAGSPDWIGQPEVKRRIAAGQLGFVYGSFNGTWARASYPGDPWQPLDDGFLPIAEWVTSDEEAAREMIAWAAGWADYPGGLDELLPVGMALIRTAGSTGLTPNALQELFDRLGIAPRSPQQPDLRAALVAAEQFNGATAAPDPVIGGVAGPAGAPAAAAPAAAAPAPRSPAPPAAAVPAGPPAGPQARAEARFEPGEGRYQPDEARHEPDQGRYEPDVARYEAEAARQEPDAARYEVDSAPYEVDSAHYQADSARYEADDDEEDEELFVVPPGISPFTGQPIGHDAGLVIGGAEPFAPEPPLTPEPPFRSESPFAPEPPFTPEPTYEPPPPAPAESQYRAEAPAARGDEYGVPGRKRRFRRKKRDEDDGEALARLGLVGPEPETPESRPQSPTGPPHYQPPGEPPRYQSQAEPPRYQPSAYAQSTPAALGPLPSSEPPRVGGEGEGEDFYASLFADAPAAATYVPDVRRDAPQDWNAHEQSAQPDQHGQTERPAWSADDATSEFTPFTDDTAATPIVEDNAAPPSITDDSQLAATPDDDTGVIDPIPADEADYTPDPPDPAYDEPQAAYRDPASANPPQADYDQPTVAHDVLAESEDEPSYDEPRTDEAAAAYEKQSYDEPTAAYDVLAESQDEPRVDEAAAAYEKQGYDEPAAADEEPEASYDEPRASYDEPTAAYDVSALDDTGVIDPIAEEAPADDTRGPTSQQAGAEQSTPPRAWGADAGQDQQTAPGQQPTPEQQPTRGQQPPRGEQPLREQQPPAEREWVGGAWINGEWVEDVAAYLAAQQQTSQPAVEPPTEERVIGSQLTEDPPTEEHLLVASADAEPSAEEPASDESVESSTGDGLSYDAPTAEIAAVLDADLNSGEPEDEYYASGPSPFAPADGLAIRNLPPNGFSSIAPEDLKPGEYAYELDGQLFHDEILGDADWTADQLADLPPPTTSPSSTTPPPRATDPSSTTASPSFSSVPTSPADQEPSTSASTSQAAQEPSGPAPHVAAPAPPAAPIDDPFRANAAPTPSASSTPEDRGRTDYPADVSGGAQHAAEGQPERTQADVGEHTQADVEEPFNLDDLRPMTGYNADQLAALRALAAPVQRGPRPLDEPGRTDQPNQHPPAGEAQGPGGDPTGGAADGRTHESDDEASRTEARAAAGEHNPAAGASPLADGDWGEESAVEVTAQLEAIKDDADDLAPSGDQDTGRDGLQSSPAAENPSTAHGGSAQRHREDEAWPGPDREDAAWAGSDRGQPGGRQADASVEEAGLESEGAGALWRRSALDETAGRQPFAPIEDLDRGAGGELTGEAEVHVESWQQEASDHQLSDAGADHAHAVDSEQAPHGDAIGDPEQEPEADAVRGSDFGRAEMPEPGDEVEGAAAAASAEVNGSAFNGSATNGSAVFGATVGGLGAAANGRVAGRAEGGGPEEELVAPPASSAVAIPGLGVVGGEGAQVEAEPGSIEEAMRAEYERPRPRPKESEALKALREWCRARTKIVPSGFTIQVQVLDPAAPSYRFDLEPPAVDDPQYGAERLSGLLGELWLAESQAEQGGWLFARVDAAGRTVRIDRWYDQVPDWWDNPVEPRLDVLGLVRRLNDRGPDWQPSYLEKLYTTAR